MARAHAANACVQSDSIKGLAQSIAKPAYHRLLTAEPALRRAVPTLIIARTDACAVQGFSAAIERARRYLDAGADMTFVEAPETLDDLRAVPKLLASPQMLNRVLGGRTPIVTQAQAREMGFSLVLYANAALQGAIQGMQTALRSLRNGGVLDEAAVSSFAERQRLVDKARFEAMELRYADPARAQTGP